MKNQVRLMLEEVDCGIGTGKEFLLINESCKLNATVSKCNDDDSHIIMTLDLAVGMGSQMGEDKNLHHVCNVELRPISMIWQQWWM